MFFRQVVHACNLCNQKVGTGRSRVQYQPHCIGFLRFIQAIWYPVWTMKQCTNLVLKKSHILNTYKVQLTLKMFSFGLQHEYISTSPPHAKFSDKMIILQRYMVCCPLFWEIYTSYITDIWLKQVNCSFSWRIWIWKWLCAGSVSSH